MDSVDRDVARLWRVNRTIHELVRDRVSTLQVASTEHGADAIETIYDSNSKGYVVSQEEIDMSLDEFQDIATRGHAAIDRNNLHFYAAHSQDESQLIFIYYSDERNVGVTTMRKFLQQLEDKNIGRGIIIYQERTQGESALLLSSFAFGQTDCEALWAGH
jgi:DNA-directed RNA polymerase I, II, and III subunit RPABC1